MHQVAIFQKFQGVSIRTINGFPQKPPGKLTPSFVRQTGPMARIDGWQGRTSRSETDMETHILLTECELVWYSISTTYVFTKLYFSCAWDKLANCYIKLVGKLVSEQLKLHPR